MKDSYFKEAFESDVSINDCIAGRIYGGGYQHGGQVVAAKPHTTVTMLDILFLCLNDIPKTTSDANPAANARSIQLHIAANGGDLTDLCNFQAAMMEVLRTNTVNNANLATYVTAVTKCILRLKKYIEYCQTLGGIGHHHTRVHKTAANQELDAILGLLRYKEGDMTVLLAEKTQLERELEQEKQAIRTAEMTYPEFDAAPESETYETDLEEYKAERERIEEENRTIVQEKYKDVLKKQRQIEALRAKIIARQEQGIFRLYNLLFTDKNSDAKGYIHSIDHSEIMLHVLRQAGALSASPYGRIIISGKCPCPDCDAFIASNIAEINTTFDNNVMIGYNYGWKSTQEKSNHRLRCVQLTLPTKIGNPWPNASMAHVSHMGTTPIGKLHPHATELKLYVLGACFGAGTTITNSGCTAAPRGKGSCTITGVLHPIFPSTSRIRWNARTSAPTT